MKRVYNILLGVMAMVLAVGCGEQRKEGTSWGVTEYYADFMFWDYEPVMMEKTLEVVLSPDAVKMFNQEGCYATFYVSGSKDGYVAPKGIDVYFNGDECKNHSFSVDMFNVHGEGDEKVAEFKLGLQFNDSAAEGEHVVYFGYDVKNIKCLNSVSISGSVPHSVDVEEDLQWVFGTLDTHGVVVEKRVIMNPVKEKFMWAGIIFVVLFVLSVVISRMITPTIKVNRITITGVYQRLIRARGYNAVVLTSQRKKQGLFHKLYKGTTLYEVHSSWTSDIKITPRNSKRRRAVAMDLDSSYYACDSRIIEQKSVGVIEDLKTHQKTTLKVE